jgi:hypothetical protein
MRSGFKNSQLCCSIYIWSLNSFIINDVNFFSEIHIFLKKFQHNSKLLKDIFDIKICSRIKLIFSGFYWEEEELKDNFIISVSISLIFFNWAHFFIQVHSFFFNLNLVTLLIALADCDFTSKLCLFLYFKHIFLINFYFVFLF